MRVLRLCVNPKPRARGAGVWCLIAALQSKGLSKAKRTALCVVAIWHCAAALGTMRTSDLTG